MRGKRQSARPGARTSRPNDHFGDRAKREGYPARSVYKLEEIDRRIGLLKPGMKVLDLGAFPGSWTLYAAKRVGPSGRVLGLDIQPFQGRLPAHAEIRTVDVFAAGDALSGQRFDVVLSDMAPSTTGARNADQYRSYELFCAALSVAEELLVPRGAFVGKIFQGAEFEDARAKMRAAFDEVRILKPEASRSESYEVFLCGKGRREAART